MNRTSMFVTLSLILSLARLMADHTPCCCHHTSRSHRRGPRPFRPIGPPQLTPNRGRQPLDDGVPQPGHVVVAELLIVAPDCGQIGVVGPIDMLHDLGEVASAAPWTLAQRGPDTRIFGPVKASSQRLIRSASVTPESEGSLQ